jgi:EAL domain-containing protein (putative c-di-GMP-specific phosphodiesterase class I)
MIKEIINKELIEIHFQPIVSIRSKKLYAFEALTRCTYKGEVIPPYELFKLAIDANLNLELDVLTRNKSIEKFKKYYLENNELILFLNFEPSLINDFNAEEQNYCFTEAIDKVEIPYKNFILEIKEDEISNTKALKEFCAYYKELGFAIALDDFGTGNSTFDRINVIKPDLIKIDKSLFQDTKNNHINREIIKSIARMGHNLGIRVLAEGVEDEDAICLALKSNVNLFQGYYFSRPVFELDTFLMDKLTVSMNEIGSLFKKMTLDSISKKRDLVNNYNLLSNQIIEQFVTIHDSEKILKTELLNHNDLEAFYLIDVNSAKQIHDTVIDNKNERFIPSKAGDEHYLKEYFYITLESKQGIFLSPNYVSYATGNICKTFAKRFELENKSYIICIDLVIKEN